MTRSPTRSRSPTPATRTSRSITVDDSLLGDLSDDFADTLAAGDSESHDFTYTVTENSPDPVPNAVTATGAGVNSEDAVDDTAICSTDILQPRRSSVDEDLHARSRRSVTRSPTRSRVNEHQANE